MWSGKILVCMVLCLSAVARVVNSACDCAVTCSDPRCRLVKQWMNIGGGFCYCHCDCSANPIPKPPSLTNPIPKPPSFPTNPFPKPPSLPTNPFPKPPSFPTNPFPKPPVPTNPTPNPPSPQFPQFPPGFPTFDSAKCEQIAADLVQCSVRVLAAFFDPEYNLGPVCCNAITHFQDYCIPFVQFPINLFGLDVNQHCT